MAEAEAAALVLATATRGLGARARPLFRGEGPEVGWLRVRAWRFVAIEEGEVAETVGMGIGMGSGRAVEEGGEAAGNMVSLD
jgi:hypothetical protein